MRAQLWAALLAGIAVLSTACTIGADVDSPGPFYDGDGDGISDAVETNPANAHHNFDQFTPNPDPSFARGVPSDGSLDGGINLRDFSFGYYHYLGDDDVDTDDWGTLALLNTVEGTGRRWLGVEPGTTSPCWSAFRGAHIGVGDLSRQTGGLFPPHRLHQNGLDVDMRYVRSDNLEGPVDASAPDTLFDLDGTLALFNCFLRAGRVRFFIIDTQYVGIRDTAGTGLIVHDSTHRNHFHVQILQF